MIYVFRLFAVEPDGGRQLIHTEKQRIKSKNLVDSQANAMMKNLLFDGRRAEICSISDQAGSFVCEVKTEALEHA